MIRRYSKNEINDLVGILQNNGVISVPTDTVYGICALLNSKIAYENLMKVKNRPVTKLLPIMCANEEQIKKIAILNDNAKRIINKFMPGPITLVLKARKKIPKYINNGGDTVAVRIAPTQEIKEIIIKLNSPIFMSSANQSGESPCKNIDEIEKNIPLLNGILEGEIIFGQGSTIIDCSSNEIKILREGPISLKQIMKEI